MAIKAADTIEQQFGKIEQLEAENESLRRALHDAQTQHRTEYCEEAKYDCAALGRERQLRELYANELTKLRRERSELRKLCRENGLLPKLEEAT